jgi:hypothetical protein
LEKENPVIRIVLIALAVLVCRCVENPLVVNKWYQLNPKDPADYFRVDFQYGFSQSSTRLAIDDSLVFEGQISTGEIIGLAGSHDVPINKGSHRVHCTIDDRAGDTLFSIVDSLVLGIHKNPETGSIGFIIYPAGRFPYYN